MTELRFCAWCGGPLVLDGGVPYCPADDRHWYRNPAPTVGAAIVRDGRALVTVRAGEPEKGRVDVPGGFLEPGETPVQGLKREIREELGVEIEVDDADYVQAVPHAYGDRGDMTLALGFTAQIVSGDPRPSDDVAGFHWVADGDLDKLDFAWKHDRDLIRKALNRETR